MKEFLLSKISTFIQTKKFGILAKKISRKIGESWPKK